MKSILLIVLFPLATYALPKVSVSCLFLGEWGCDAKCSLKCLLLGCASHEGTCDGWSHCGCNETYNMGGITLTNYDFENLDFVQLWNSIFVANDASARILERVKKDDDLEIFLIKLLRDTYMTGDDIISLLRQEYPNWKAVNSLVSLQHGWKTEIMESGKHIQYNELDANMDKLLELIKTVPPEHFGNSQYKLRVNNLLKNITKVEDLEEILYLVKLSGYKNLYSLVKSSLKNLGYGFEEDGDNKAGKKAILHSISIDLDDADDDEKLEVAVAKKFVNTNSGSNSSTRQNVQHIGDIGSFVRNFNAPNPAAAPPAHLQYSEMNYFPWTAGGVSTAANNGYGNTYWKSIASTSSGNLVTGQEGYGNSFNGGQLINTSAQASKAFILVVDANGNIVQANEMAKNVDLPLAYISQQIA